MRIGFDITPLTVPRSGVGTYTANLFEHLQRSVHDEIIPLTHRPPLSGEGISYDLPLPLGRGWGLNKTLWMQVILPWQLAERQIEVGHFTNNVAPLFAPCSVTLTIHDMTLWLFPEHHYRRRLLAMRPFIPLAARQASAIITVSESAKQDIVRILNIPQEKVHVIYEAAAPIFQPITEKGRLEQVRQRYNLPERFFLYVGTIEPRKNIVRLLEAFAQLHHSNAIPHVLLLAGARGWKDDPVFATVERLQLSKRVRFLDFVPASDLVALYNLADTLAFPSLYEGFGLPVVEAMACGTPVVTSAKGSLGEVAGNAAQFVDPIHVESIAEGLYCVLSDLNQQRDLRERGLARAATFSWEATAQRTHQLYRKVGQEKQMGSHQPFS